MERAASIALAGLGAAAVLIVSACANQPPRPTVVKEPGCVDFSFPVYFQDRSDELTTPAAQSIAASVMRTKSCRVASLTVIGLVRKGDGDLADERLAAVTKALVANGLADPAPMMGDQSGSGGLFGGRRVVVQVRFTGDYRPAP